MQRGPELFKYAKTGQEFGTLKPRELHHYLSSNYPSFPKGKLGLNE